MNAHSFSFSGATLDARPDRSLYWPAENLLVVSDLHLGKSERMARRGGALLPPYETRETLDRLDAAIEATRARTVICLGDSFDDLDAVLSLSEEETAHLTRLQAGRRWVWIEGNHDPGPLDLGGTHLAELRIGPLLFRHIHSGGTGEVSGHYHPKLRIPGTSAARPCFLYDLTALILPSFGAYTGGLSAKAAPLATLMGPEAIAIVTGRKCSPVPLSKIA